jgi:N-acylneuraminate cytidylyltransferase
MHIVALIPARSGSKGIEHKNIKLYKNKPLLVHSIEIAFQSQYIDDVYVSTDSLEYKEISKQYGAQVLIRPKQISDDLSSDMEVFEHFLENIDTIPDMIVHLRPTYPNRTKELLDNTIQKFIENYDKYDSLRTVIKIDKTPYKMYTIEKDHLRPIIQNHPFLIEPYNQPRQYFPDTYLHNGCIDIVKTSCIMENHLLSGTNILPFIMDSHENNDIDNIHDFILSEQK